MATTRASGADWSGGGQDNNPNRDDAPSYGMSPGRSMAQFGTAALAGMSPSAAQRVVDSGGGGGAAQSARAAVASQQALQSAEAYFRALKAESARVQAAEDFRAQEAERARVQGLGGSVGGYDLYQGVMRNALNDARQKLAASLANNPASLSGLDIGTNLGNRYMQQKFVDMFGSREGPRGNEAYQNYLDAPRLARPVYGRAGEVTGIYDEYGRLTGRDIAREEQERDAQRGQGDGGDGGMPRPQYVLPEPVTGQCPAGYVFDVQLNACRLDTGAGAAQVAPAQPAPGTYARMGLLDQAPTGLLEFSQQYGAGFGSPQDYLAANTAFRKRAGTVPEYYNRPPSMSGYTLLS